jgi:hypothetical protein
MHLGPTIFPSGLQGRQRSQFGVLTTHSVGQQEYAHPASITRPAAPVGAPSDPELVRSAVPGSRRR